MKKLLTIFLFSFFSLNIYPQQHVGNVIDSLKVVYSLYPGKYPDLKKFEDIPPPPPLIDSACSRHIEAYAIPPHVIMGYYPWNADSIAISFDMHLAPEERRRIKLEKEDIEVFIDALYKFDWENKCLRLRISITTILAWDTPIPNFRLTFYHGADHLFADFYQHMSNPLTINDSSCGDPYSSERDPYSMEHYFSQIDWGGQSRLTFSLFTAYIQKRFGIDVGEGKYESDFPPAPLIIDPDYEPVPKTYF